MAYTLNEIKTRALDFSREHSNDNDEKGQAQTFWRDFFEIWGVSTRKVGAFEARAKTLKGNTGFVDFFWPGTLMVEHKSRGLDLDKALKQALDYCTTGGIPDPDLPRYIVVSDFARFRLVDLTDPCAAAVEFPLEALHENTHHFNFILGYEKRVYRDEDPVNLMAAELMGAIHDQLLASGFRGHELEVFLVRLMFCLFADDTGIFPKDHLEFYLEDRTRPDGVDLGAQLALIFQILDTAPEKRQITLDPDLNAFPYVNGGLFEERLTVPMFTEEMRATLIHVCRFNWAMVSPAIFGSLFQSVMDEGARRHLGAHYTSEKNILKTIHPLFLDELTAELERNRTNERGLNALLAKIRGIRLLDPACGCGNFLILAYRELRLLEIEIHKAIQGLSRHKYADLSFYHGIDVDHLYGIEIEEFPAQIARVALWIMDHLMNVRLGEAFGEYLPRLPLKASPHIVHGNALRIDWKEVVKPEELTYILGNPPFVGKTYQSPEQRADKLHVITEIRNASDLDFVAAWHVKAAVFTKGTGIKTALVSTNSITQGEQAPLLWNWLFRQGLEVFFAHRTFRWSNEAQGNAAVHCVIIGFSYTQNLPCTLFDYSDERGEPVARRVPMINGYLVGSRHVPIQKRSAPLCPVSPMGYGSKPTDGGHLLFTAQERDDFLRLEPLAATYFRRFVKNTEFINNEPRFCLWLLDCPPEQLRRMPMVLERVARVRQARLASTAAPTVKSAELPSRFFYVNQPTTPYLLLPGISSSNRTYIPIGFLTPEVVAGDNTWIIPAANLFTFGVLQSAMHMAWTRVVSGRIKSDFQYSASIVYNNLPWPRSVQATLDSKDSGVAAVEKAAQAVLDVRAQFPESSLADLYDPLTMPPDLVKAHNALDRAVDRCYRSQGFTSELDRVEYLFGLYEEFTVGLLAVGRKKGKKS